MSSEPPLQEKKRKLNIDESLLQPEQCDVVTLLKEITEEERQKGHEIGEVTQDDIDELNEYYDQLQINRPSSPYIDPTPYDTQTVTDEYIEELKSQGVNIPTISVKKYEEMQDYYSKEFKNQET